jgi:hypothetical protein
MLKLEPEVIAAVQRRSCQGSLSRHVNMRQATRSEVSR